MKRMKSILPNSLLFISIFSIIACSNSNEYTIEGYIEGASDSTLIKLYDLTTEEYIDSCFTINEEFIFRGNVEYPRTLWLFCNKDVAALQVENVPIKFKSKINHFQQEAIVKGGYEQDLANEVRRLQRPYQILIDNAFDSLVNKKYEDESMLEKLGNRYNELLDKSHSFYVNSAIKNPNSFYSIDALFRNRLSIPIDSLKQILENVDSKYRESVKGKAIMDYVSNQKVEVGKPFIDFNTKTIEGDDFQLSTLKGKYIFIHFWSSGCAYCRKENRLLSENFNKLPDSIILVSFSLDKKRENWVSSSLKDSIFWYNVSDLKGDLSSTKLLYDVQALPVSFLIDRNGIVVEKILGYDENLIDILLQQTNENKDICYEGV
jgi:thiol-disulfide isomerase/thioredoxin